MFKRLFICMFVLLLGGASISQAQTSSPTFVLVHGAFQDASGWDATIAALESAGYQAVAVQLPGRGDDSTPVSELNLALYRDTIIETINVQAEPVILVGHSFGGVSISNVAEAIPSRIQALVYVAAYLPQNGESLLALAQQDRYSVLGQEGNFIVSEDGAYGSIPAEVFPAAFCPDCTPEQAEAVVASELREPIGPQAEPVTLTAENYGSVQKVYVMTAQDVVVSPALQALMLANTPVDHVYALNTGHTPYITQPEALAGLLVEAASQG
jgi:pimeloyl-ACP methyl ester carboxylesterase